MKPKEKKQRTVRSPEPNGKRAQLRPIGLIRSSIKQRSEAPKQGSEGAPDAWLEVSPLVAKGLHGLAVGDDIIVVTWLHLARRDVLKVHPRSDRTRPVTGVFATRSPDRPNPLGLHPVTVREVEKNRLRIGPIEAIDGTPVVDIDRKSTRLNSSHGYISYAVFCLKKKKNVATSEVPVPTHIAPHLRAANANAAPSVPVVLIPSSPAGAPAAEGHTVLPADESSQTKLSRLPRTLHSNRSSRNSGMNMRTLTNQSPERVSHHTKLVYDATPSYHISKQSAKRIS